MSARVHNNFKSEYLRNFERKKPKFGLKPPEKRQKKAPEILMGHNGY